MKHFMGWNRLEIKRIMLFVALCAVVSCKVDEVRASYWLEVEDSSSFAFQEGDRIVYNLIVREMSPSEIASSEGLPGEGDGFGGLNNNTHKVVQRSMGQLSYRSGGWDRIRVNTVSPAGSYVVCVDFELRRDGEEQPSLRGRRTAPVEEGSHTITLVLDTFRNL